MRAPTIHLNGTYGPQLITEWRLAKDGLLTASRAVACIDINARDYYPQGEGAYGEAIERLNKMNDTLAALYAEVSEVYRDLVSQQQARER